MTRTVLGRAAVYCRSATGDRSRGDQASACRDFAAAHADRLEIVAEPYIDAACPGTRLDRPALRRLLDDARAGRFDSVLVDGLHRLGRGRSAAAVIAALNKENIAVTDIAARLCVGGDASINPFNVSK